MVPLAQKALGEQAMSTIFTLDVNERRLTRLQRMSMTELGLKEPRDLEAWLASAGGGIFGRDVIWIARQDRPSEEQRSDLIGVDKLGNVLVTELKRGVLSEEAITQALAYAAEYSDKSAADLAALFAVHSEKSQATGLVTKASSLDDAQRQLSKHVGVDTELNESQVLLLVGEDFTAKTLAICDYLNRSSGESSFSVECWRYFVFTNPAGAHYFLLEQVLPPPSVRQEIEEKREASKARKYARDPVRVEFMRELLAYLGASADVTSWRSRGQSYECRIKSNLWTSDHDLWFSVNSNRPRLLLPIELGLRSSAASDQILESVQEDGRRILEFSDVDLRSAKFSAAFGERLIGVVGALVESSTTNGT
jgi:hypothetical protein